jgi:FKBP-type peptidyl-prolyl cis-trans isomerase
LTNKRGTIAILRGSLSGSGHVGQFFINVADNGRLDAPRNRGLFAAFGKVIKGQDIIDRIRVVPVSTHPQYAAGKADVVPVDPVIIESIRIMGSFNAAQIQSVVQEQIEARKHAVEIKIAELEQQTGRKIVTADSGIQYIDLRIGHGPPILITDTVMFNYEGSLADGSVFESTFVDEPKVLPMTGLIEGLREGILTINEGGSRFIIVPPELGYGEVGIPGIIPPESTLFYRIELLEIRPTP